MISICETSLNDSVETLINEYNSAPANNPANTRHEGGGGGGGFSTKFTSRYSEK